ncbi:MAG: DUF4157 domain-containing protein [Pseudomonadota bacterium]
MTCGGGKAAGGTLQRKGAPTAKRLRRMAGSNAQSQSSGSGDSGLQERIGMRRAQAMGVQAQLTVGRSDDPAEKRADAAANKIMKMTNGQGDSGACPSCAMAGGTASGPVRRMAEDGATPLQRRADDSGAGLRRAAEDGAETLRRCPSTEAGAAAPVRRSGTPDGEIQRKTEPGALTGDGGGLPVPASVEPQIRRLQSGGDPLPEPVRAQMEAGFGRNFGDVRVHTDATAASASTAIGAKAFTIGHHIAFNRGQFAPGTREGDHLIAHEMAHVAENRENGGVVQRSAGEFFEDLLEDAQDVGSEFLDDVSDTASAAVDSVTEGGYTAAMAIVERISPLLADIIRRGPKTVLSEKLEGYAEDWVAEQSEDIAPGPVDEALAIAKENLEASAAKSAEGSDCGIFQQRLASIYGLITAFRASPLPTVLGTLWGIVTFPIDLAKRAVGASLRLIGGTLWVTAEGIIDLISGAIETVRDWGGWVWDEIKGPLGITADDEEAIERKLDEAWDFVRGDVAPGVLEGTGAYLDYVRGASGLGTLNAAVGFVEGVTAEEDPTRDKDPHGLIAFARQMPSAITEKVPELIEKIRQRGQWITDGIAAAGTGLVEGAAHVGKLASGIVGKPIVGGLFGLLTSLQTTLLNWGLAIGVMAGTLFERITGWVTAAWEAIKPFVNVIALLAAMFVSPVLLPIVVPALLAAQAWQELPDCYKGPLIDFLLVTGIGLLEAAEDNAFFGPIWPILRRGVLGFLQGLLGATTEEKVAATSRIATIILTEGTSFLTGYITGMLKGIWDGITDIVMLFHYLGTGMKWLADQSRQLAASLREGEAGGSSGVTGAAASAEPGPGAQEAETTEASTGASETEAPASPTAGAGLPEAGAGATAGPDESVHVVMTPEEYDALAESFEETGTLVTEEGPGAMRDHFTAGEGGWDGLMRKIGEIWEASLGLIQGLGQSLGQQAIAQLLPTGDAAADRQINATIATTTGKGLGYIVGTVLVEVIVSTVGTPLSGAAKAVSSAIRNAGRAMAAGIRRVVGWAVSIGTRLAGIGRQVMQFVNQVVRILGRNAGARMRRLLASIRAFVRRLLGYGDEVAGAVPRRPLGALGGLGNLSRNMARYVQDVFRETLKKLRGWAKRYYDELNFKGFTVETDPKWITIYGYRSPRKLLARIRRNTVVTYIIEHTDELMANRHARASVLGRSRAARARGDAVQAGVLRGGAIRQSEKIGEYAAKAAVETELGLAESALKYVGAGRGTVDLLYKRGRQVIIVEAKGGRSALGYRWTDAMTRAQQGSVTYLRNMLDEMIAKGGDEAKYGRMVLDALNSGNLRYFHASTKIPPGTGKLETKLREFLIPGPRS